MVNYALYVVKISYLWQKSVIKRKKEIIQQRIAVLGSTGSIGRQTLDTVASYADRFKVSVLTAGSNLDLLSQQAAKFRPHRVVVAAPRSREAFESFRSEMDSLGIKAYSGACLLCPSPSPRDS